MSHLDVDSGSKRRGIWGLIGKKRFKLNSDFGPIFLTSGRIRISHRRVRIEYSLMKIFKFIKNNYWYVRSIDAERQARRPRFDKADIRGEPKDSLQIDVESRSIVAKFSDAIQIKLSLSKLLKYSRLITRRPPGNATLSFFTCFFAPNRRPAEV